MEEGAARNRMIDQLICLNQNPFNEPSITISIHHGRRDSKSISKASPKHPDESGMSLGSMEATHLPPQDNQHGHPQHPRHRRHRQHGQHLGENFWENGGDERIFRWSIVCWRIMIG